MALERLARQDSGRIAATAASAVILTALLVLLLWSGADRRRTIEQGHRNAFNLANVLKEQVGGMVAAVDLTLNGVIDALALVPHFAEHDPALEDSLRHKLLSLPFVRAIFVIGADGFITQDTDHPFTPRRNLADRDYFKVHVEKPELGVYLGAPVQSRSTGTWFVSMSRRINGPDGAFAGVAVAALELSRVAAFYRLLELGAHDSISLFLRDGTFLLRIPEGRPSVGDKMGDLPLFRIHLPTTPNGSFRSTTTFDGRPRLISYRTLDNAPIVVAVGVDEEALLAVWRRSALVSAGAFIAFAATLSALVAIFVRSRTRYRRAYERHLNAQRLETLGRMTGGIAHDVNNCLTIVTSGLRLIKQDGAPNADVLSRISESVAHCSALMRQLLMFSKQQSLDLHDVDIVAELGRLRPLIRQATGSAVAVAMDVPGDLWPCRADQTQFSAAILNLAVNAADAMPSGGTLKVTARNLHLPGASTDFHRPEGDYVAVCVADTGQGMSPDTARKAIEPFFSTKGEGGTGLGLSQVYGFMQQIGGDLRIDSRIGHGTSVHLLFPRSAVQADAAGQNANVPPGAVGRGEIRAGGLTRSPPAGR